MKKKIYRFVAELNIKEIPPAVKGLKVISGFELYDKYSKDKGDPK